jgi:peptidoglycan hydrolase CwlO-like protein
VVDELKQMRDTFKKNVSQFKVQGQAKDCKMTKLEKELSDKNSLIGKLKLEV